MKNIVKIVGGLKMAANEQGFVSVQEFEKLMFSP